MPDPAHHAEQALLGALLLDPAQLDRVTELRPEHFAHPAHAALHAAMRALTPPDPAVHAREPAWPNAVLAHAAPTSPGLTYAYLHELLRACPRPAHAPAYARMIRVDHLHRTLRTHADRLTHTATDPHQPDPVAAVRETATRILDDLDHHATTWGTNPGALPRTPIPNPPTTPPSSELLDEERHFLAAATNHPTFLDGIDRLRPDDFASPLHGNLYRCIADLAHRGDFIDPITLLWEAHRRGLFTTDFGADDLLQLTAHPTGPPEPLADEIFHRAVLNAARTSALHIRTYADDLANTPHQLINATRNTLTKLTTGAARRHHATLSTRPTRTPPPRTQAHLRTASRSRQPARRTW